MWELDYKESWAQKNWCFWTVVLEKTLESCLDCKEIQPVHPKGDQSWVFIGWTDVELKFQYFGHLMQRADSLEKTLILGKIEGRRRRGWQRMRWLDGITDSWTWVWMNSGSWWWTGRPGVLQSMGLQRVGHNWVTELNWTEPFKIRPKSKFSNRTLRIPSVGNLTDNNTYFSVCIILANWLCMQPCKKLLNTYHTKVIACHA